MNYPLISEYLEAIKSAEDNFAELSYLRPVLGNDGMPVMSVGNFAVVFKMKDEQSGDSYALKCFTKEQEGREEAYREIAKELENVSSPYLVSVRYLEKELFVDTAQTEETEFPVLLMDWVEGKTLDKYIRENLDNKYVLEMLAYRFSQLAQWLIPQSFAHGDLKPDNILVREDGTLVLVDYDGMYVPAMKGQKARELGTPDFRHPQRTIDDFDNQIDNFSIISILFSLKAISDDPQLLKEYGATDRMLLSENDYKDLYNCAIIKHLYPSTDVVLNKICAIFTLILYDYKFCLSPRLIPTWEVSTECLFCFFKLGELYQKGTEVRQNVNLSTKYFKIAAELGHMEAQYKLGVCYANGSGIELDDIKALYWFEKAANQGYIRALYNIGYIYKRMNNSNAEFIFRDVVEKAKLLLERHDSDSDASAILGICLLQGYGLVEDEKEAFIYLKQAAEKGNSNAQANLGYCYYWGKGIGVDKSEAIKWFRMSSNQGNAKGESMLGQCYMNADGIEGNKLLGIDLLKKSANQGHAPSYNTLGCCYFLGNGVDQDYGKAFCMFKKAAERDYPMGMYNLGLCFEKGLGTISNRDQARFWYEKAASNENQKAQDALERFATEDLPF